MNATGSVISPHDVLVRAQSTPNPSALKFIVNQPLKNEGKATFTDEEQCQHLPLPSALFSIVGVTQLHFFQNTVTVSHTSELSDSILRDQVEAVLKTRVPIHDPEFKVPDESGKKTPTDRSNLTPELREIEEILDRTIRPGLQADGGDIEVISLEGNELRILYQGACGGCPSAMMGTLDAIEGILQAETQNPELRVSPI